ncbi:hypothetical protein [Clostridium sporogenes]|nr:hypothetical protein [Clostridium sporogenes]
MISSTKNVHKINKFKRKNTKDFILMVENRKRELKEEISFGWVMDA